MDSSPTTMQHDKSRSQISPRLILRFSDIRSGLGKTTLSASYSQPNSPCGMSLSDISKTLCTPSPPDSKYKAKKYLDIRPKSETKRKLNLLSPTNENFQKHHCDKRWVKAKLANYADLSTRSADIMFPIQALNATDENAASAFSPHGLSTSEHVPSFYKPAVQLNSHELSCPDYENKSFLRNYDPDLPLDMSASASPEIFENSLGYQNIPNKGYSDEDIMECLDYSNKNDFFKMSSNFCLDSSDECMSALL